MDFPPFGKRLFPLVTDQLHGTAQIVRRHAFGPNKGRKTIGPDEVDPGLSVPEHMHMGWFVVISEDDDAPGKL